MLSHVSKESFRQVSYDSNIFHLLIKSNMCYAYVSFREIMKHFHWSVSLLQTALQVVHGNKSIDIADLMNELLN